MLEVVQTVAAIIAAIGDEPTDESKRIMRETEGPAGWKYATKPYYTFDKTLADSICYCYDWHLGGHELSVVEVNQYGTLYRVTSKGYYHYVGA